MADPVLDLCNRALNDAGGRATIASLTEGSNEAACANRYFGSAVTYVLTRARWNFAQTAAAGVAVATASPLPRPWTLVYQYPVDCLRVKSLEAPLPAGAPVPIFGAALSALQSQPRMTVPFALGSVDGARAILTNLPSAIINYTRNVADLTQWEPQALIALEMVLASKMAIPLSGDKTLARSLFEQAEAAMHMAMVADANEDTSRQDLPVDWLNVRDGGWLPPVGPFGPSNY